ncbi:FAD-dependent oxidoreductase [Bacillus daqingensis]|uniref:FAD-dependent oxidoreductase n=1 Tax=Bacillus daqingensis TaxID=872396 RepID=A0ABV9NWP8_9BACI
MKVVIIGGDAAGMSAAMQIVHKREDASITVLERGGIYSYGQCGLPYYLGGTVDEAEDLIARPVSFFRDKGIDAKTYHEVTKVESDKQLVHAFDHESSSDVSFSYDVLLCASGGSPLRLPVDGADLEGIHTLKTIPDAKAIKDDLEQTDQITIVGAGYIGLEVAENYVEQGKKVRLINRSDKLGSNFDETVSEALREEAEKHGIELHLHEDVTRFEGEDGRVSRIVTTKGSYEADGVIVAVGISPNTSYLEGTGVHLHYSGAAIVDPYMRTNVANIYAAGDCATQYHRIKEQHDYVPLGTHANKQGRVAGANISGERKTFQGIVGTAIMRFFDLTAGRTGIGVSEAKETGYACSVKVIETHPYADYFPGANKMKLQLVKDDASGRLLGIQAVGTTGVDKRIDAASVMIYNNMTTTDIQHLDLSYAPPYNSTWDPVQKGVRAFK